jgi:hypothetical protein
MTKPTGNPRGRPRGSINKRIIGRELTAHRLEHNRERNAVGLHALSVRRAKLMPLEVMENNMAWACNDAAIELQAILDKAKSEGDAKTQLAVFVELRKLRAVSQSFARDAAPYRHAKLHAVSVAEKPELTLKLLNPFQHRQAEILDRFRPKSTAPPYGPVTGTESENCTMSTPKEEDPCETDPSSVVLPGKLARWPAASAVG